MELAAPDRGDLPGRLTMAAIGHVLTIARVAELLGESEDLLHEFSVDMFPGNGRVYIVGTGEDITTAFTDLGVETLRDIIRERKP